MQLDIPYATTARGEAFLEQKAVGTTPMPRDLLHLLDGRSTARDLLPQMKVLGFGVADLQRLVDLGLAEPVVEAAAIDGAAWPWRVSPCSERPATRPPQ